MDKIKPICEFSASGYIFGNWGGSSIFSKTNSAKFTWKYIANIIHKIAI
jgi:hypothetical protein